ncbi:MAG: TonB-dependent siderophore myxochelin receptor MxcH [Myxococcota bacterium]
MRPALCLCALGSLLPQIAWADAGSPDGGNLDGGLPDAGRGGAKSGPGADGGAPSDGGAAHDAGIADRTSPDASKPRLEPPRLIDEVQAEYPEEARRAGREGSVVLILTLDTEGRVVEARVDEPAGHGLDEAARKAALRFRFAPARKNGEPVPARIRYVYRFRLAPQGESKGAPQQPAPASGSGEGASPSDPAEERDPAPATEDEPPPLDVHVRAATEGEQLERSAESVQVLSTGEARGRSADLGEVMARTEGVAVRRGGGLGSGTRFSIGGLTDDQIRIFLDGIPLEWAGYPFGIANVPVNGIERIEIYRGTVPLRFGADALGGAVNLVTPDDLRPGTRGSASYLAGSFGTHRLTGAVQHVDEATGAFVRAGGFFDRSDNDYTVDVEVADGRGKLSPAEVRRFHDAYRAGGGHVEAGFTERPWADRLAVRVFGTDYRKELQNNLVMTVPYGEARFDEQTAGGAIRYEHAPTETLRVDLVAGYHYGRTRLLDVGECVYDWFGRCVNERAQAGEIETKPRDQVQWQHTGYARFNLSWEPADAHALRVALAPSYATRTGDERRQSDPNGRDPLTAERDLFTLVTGVEHEVTALDGRLENIAFIKDYLQLAQSEEVLPGNVFAERDRQTHRLGVGNGLRYRFVEWLYAKVSYEWATRLPQPEEIFGDGVLIAPNLELAPETSHNLGLQGTVDDVETTAGRWRARLYGFLRETDRLIVLIGNDRVFTYQNVFGARSLGAEASAGWTSPGDHLALDGNVTYVDHRNTSSEGTFGDFEGDRIPNRPYLFANGSARIELQDVAAESDELAFTWDTRYVHAFFRGWESVGRTESKQVIPDQLVHTAGVTYSVRGDPANLTFSGEVHNLTDARVFDFFGLQRPGRAFYFKATAEL